MKTKFLTIVAAAALAAMLGLTACGGQQASGSASAAASGSETAASSETAAGSAAAVGSEAAAGSAAAVGSEAASDEAESTQIALVGATADGKYVIQYANVNNPATQKPVTALLLENMKTRKTDLYSGDAVQLEDGMTCELTNADGKKIQFVVGSVAENGTTSVVLEKYGSAKLMPGDFESVNAAIKRVMLKGEKK